MCQRQQKHTHTQTKVKSHIQTKGHLSAARQVQKINSSSLIIANGGIRPCNTLENAHTLRAQVLSAKHIDSYIVYFCGVFSCIVYE